MSNSRPQDFQFAPETPAPARHEPWKLMIVDDEEDIHAVTKLALDNFTLDGRPILFIDAYSGREAVDAMERNPDTALVLMDVVMESEHAGLEAIDAIRHKLGNDMVRIIVRTAHPGQAPEHEVVTRYDINDYKEKTDLTAKKLFTSVYTSLMIYEDLRAAARSRVALDQIAEASSTVLRHKVPEQVARGALQLLAGVLGVVEAGETPSFGAILVRNATDPEAPVLCGVGRFAGLTGEPALGAAKALTHIGKVPDDRAWTLGPRAFAARIRGHGTPLGLYLEADHRIAPIEGHVLDVLCRAIETALHVAELNREVYRTQYELIVMLSEAIEQRSKETGHHVRRVGEYSRLLAQLSGLPDDECDTLLVAAALHDAGKIAIPDAILTKPGGLTPAERKVMEAHAEIGAQLFAGKELPVLKAAMIIAGQHHERWDGMGYPNRLAGEQIHLYGRIVALADVFDALGSHRCYKQAWPTKEVLKTVEDERGRHFDPKLVDLLTDHLDRFLAIRDRFADPN